MMSQSIADDVTQALRNATIVAHMCEKQYVMPQSHHTPGPHTGCTRAVHGLFWKKNHTSAQGAHTVSYDFRLPVEGR